jgi:hypothetical protein
MGCANKRARLDKPPPPYPHIGRANGFKCSLAVTFPRLTDDDYRTTFESVTSQAKA